MPSVTAPFFMWVGKVGASFATFLKSALFQLNSHAGKHPKLLSFELFAHPNMSFGQNLKDR